MFALLTEIAKQAGIIGLVVAVMGGGFALVIRTLWNQHLEAMAILQRRLDEANAHVIALHEKRIKDAESSRDIAIELSAKIAVGLERIALLIDFMKVGTRGK